jgi:putative oxidoreductase
VKTADTNRRFFHDTRGDDAMNTIEQIQIANPGNAHRWATLSRQVTATTADAGATVARVSLALILFPHGAQHALGWFGGHGFAGTFGWMTGTLGFPAPLAALAIVTELVAPVMLLLGLGSRLAALGLFGLMVGAASTHLQSGFFMNWFGALPAGSEGFEYHLLVMALAVVVTIKGGGAWSLDQMRTPATTPAITQGQRGR